MLEATRTRISFSGEVLTAAVFLAATVFVGSLIVRELRVARAFSATAEASSATSAGEAVPPEAVSVPALTFGVHEIKVGDAVASALSDLDPAITLVKKVVEAGPLGPREFRSYELSGMRFILVAEPFERGGELRLSAIYLQ
jgi:hypothetical protein